MRTQPPTGPVSFFFALLVILCAAIRPAAADEVRFDVIEKQARFAAAAYRSQEEARELVETLNYELSLYHSIEDIQMSFYLATSEAAKTHVVAVRGTSNAENAMVDLAVNLLADEKTGARLHQGFAYAAKQVYSVLKPELNAQFRIRTTGHSLGGAVAQILAMYLDADGFDIEQVVTFGQPKVTNLSGAAKFQHLDIVRVATPRDLVPLVPPFDPMDLQNIDIYWHAGREVLLLEDNRYAVLEGSDSMMRATRFTQQPLSEENLNNHYMSVYLQRVRAKLDSPERVPYRNTLNLFNLFENDQVN